MNLKCKEVLLEYKQYMIVEKGYSRLTIENYLRDLLKFINYMGSHYDVIQIEDIQKDYIYQYLKDLRGALKVSSIDRHMVTLRQFYIFLMKENYISENIMSSFEMSKKASYLPEVLSVEEVNQIIDSIDLDTPQSFRNRCMIEILYASGLRVSEMCNLTLQDINLHKGYVKCVGKGDKERMIPMNQNCCLLLREYIENYRLQLLGQNIVSQYLFVNKKGQPISRNNFFHILDEIVKKSGVTKHVTPHTFRHTFATHLLENDADLRSIQEMLGHSDISTSTIYTHVSNNKAIDEYKKSHPRSQRKGNRE